jgi:hypothetical protein
MGEIVAVNGGFHGLGSVKVKERGEGAADAQGEEHRAQVVAQRVASFDGLGVHIDVGKLMFIHGFSLIKQGTAKRIGLLAVDRGFERVNVISILRMIGGHTSATRFAG